MVARNRLGRWQLQHKVFLDFCGHCTAVSFRAVQKRSGCVLTTRRCRPAHGPAARGRALPRGASGAAYQGSARQGGPQPAPALAHPTSGHALGGGPRGLPRPHDRPRGQGLAVLAAARGVLGEEPQRGRLRCPAPCRHLCAHHPPHRRRCGAARRCGGEPRRVSPVRCSCAQRASAVSASPLCAQATTTWRR